MCDGGKDLAGRKRGGRITCLPFSFAAEDEEEEGPPSSSSCGDGEKVVGRATLLKCLRRREGRRESGAK